MMPAAATFAAYLLALLVAHQVADHWVQTSHQAAHKGLPGLAGVLACLRHVLAYTATLAAIGGLVWAVLVLPISVGGFVTGLLINAATHYWADRRYTLAWLARITRNTEFYRLGAPRQVVAVAASPDHPSGTVLVYRVDEDGHPDTEHPQPHDNPSLGTGAYALDQAFHWFWLFVSALVTVIL
ncbi:hypothetical protein [Amycolatopsis thermoflava]|uniref:hypothetical protein n=1 Tax=Amycolatopsis thermoflava TaxID=84480 RepID=UPI000481CBAB|nr:hypothetical protein [Amycolatopsis thermoflava]